jgi:CRP-like cAMP-binding protein
VFEDLNYEELKRRANERLSDRVVATLEARGERRSLAAGEALYRVDDRQYPFVYAISATLQIRDPDGLVLGSMDPGQFTGELALLFGQTAFADCVVVEPGEVLVVAPQTIAELIQVDPEVSDALLPAFAARRLLLMQRQQGTLTLTGREGSPALQRLLEFAERNRIPYRWLDPADPAQKEQILARGLQPSGVQVVVRGRHVLQEPSVAKVARALGLELAADHSEPVDLIIAGPGQPAFQLRFTAPPRACGPSSSMMSRSVARQQLHRASRTFSDFRPASLAPTSPSGRSFRRSSSAREWPSHARRRSFSAAAGPVTTRSRWTMATPSSDGRW